MSHVDHFGHELKVGDLVTYVDVDVDADIRVIRRVQILKTVEYASVAGIKAKSLVQLALVLRKDGMLISLPRYYCEPVVSSALMHLSADHAAFVATESEPQGLSAQDIRAMITTAVVYDEATDTLADLKTGKPIPQNDPPFKVGQRVRTLVDPKEGFAPKGFIGVVREIYNSGTWVVEVGHPKNITDSCTYLLSEIEAA